MLLKEYLRKVQGQAAVRSVLPMSQGLLYPMLTVRNGHLCAHFMANRTAVKPEGLQISHPEFYLQTVYPQGSVLCIENLHYTSAFTEEELARSVVVPPRSEEERAAAKERMAELEKLANAVLDEWNQGKSASLEKYNALLAEVMEPIQVEACRRVMGEA